MHTFATQSLRARSVVAPIPSPRTWRLWERKAEPPPAYRMQSRDIQIIEAVFRHRFLTVAHVQTLLGGSASRLALRCRLLWQDGYLERPKALRPTNILTNQIVYGLGRKGAQLLEELAASPHGRVHFEYLTVPLAIGGLDWNETPKKQGSLVQIDHQLGIASFMIALAVAARGRGVRLTWGGHFNRRQHLLAVGRDTILPDAHFTLVHPVTNMVAHHYLEIDRGNVSLKRMRERYEMYFQYWKSGHGRSFKHFRVLTVTNDTDYLNSLRRTAQWIGRSGGYRSAWKGFMFTHAQAFALAYPERILEPIWLYADDSGPVSLL